MAHVISERGSGSGAQVSQRPDGPAGAGLSNRRWPTWCGASSLAAVPSSVEYAAPWYAPVLSPDGRYVAAATADLYAGYEDSGVEVVALAAGGPRREFSRITSAADDTTGWAAVGLRWRGDTLSFDRVDVAGAQPGTCRTTPARLVRRSGRWAVEGATR